MNPATDDPVPESPDSRPRLGALLLSAGLITQEQLDESLTLAQTAGKPLGHVLVERGLVPAHSIAMALADQHGGPLKTEFGFATGRGTTPRPAALPGPAVKAPPVLRLAAAPLRDGSAAPVAPPAVAPPEPEPLLTAADLSVEREAETAARLHAEAHASELVARVEELEADLTSAHATSERAAAAADTLNAQVEELRSRRAADAAALSAGEVALAAVRGELAATRAEREAHQATADALRARATELEEAALEAAPLETAALDELRAVIELQEQALAAASARELARDGDARDTADPSGARSYSGETHFLFAPSADGYELLERTGSAPSPGDVVELSAGRACRVLRVGPPPFPGAEACAYLELV